MERANILVVGFNSTLLETRAAILNRIALHAATACSVKDALEHLANAHYDLLFLCHTVNQESAVRLLSQVNFSYPSLKVVRLHLESAPKSNSPKVDADVNMDYLPISWIRVLDGLLLEAA